MTAKAAFLLFAILSAFSLSAQTTPISLQAPRNYTGGGTDFTIADINGDGLADILSVDGTNSLHIHLGVGNGLFGPDTGSTILLQNTNGIVAGDLNGDGLIDLAVGDPAAKQVAIFFGDGKGGFQFSAAYNLSSDPVFLKLTLLNLDHYQDIVTVGNAGVSVLMGSANGLFQPAISVTTGPTIPAMAIADFNGDGKLDLVVSISNSLEFFAGQGKGAFAAPTVFGATEFPVTALDAGDVNGDGKPDLVLGFLSVGSCLGHGDGTFDAVVLSGQQAFLNGPPPTRIALADLNGDGKLDLVFPGVGVLSGRGDGRFVGTGNYPTGESSSQVTLAHIHSSRVLDIVANGPVTTVLLNNGNGTFHVPPVTNRSNGYALTTSMSLLAADFNSDGNNDILLGASSLFLGTGDRNAPFASAIYTGGVGCFEGAAIAGDFNNDGKLDLVAHCGKTTDFQAGNGDGTFQPPVKTSLPSFPYLSPVADFNGDGKLDIALAGSGTRIAYGIGNGTFDTAVVVEPALSAGTQAGDLNGDGTPDLVIWGDQLLAVLLNNGNGTFSETKYFPTYFDFYINVIVSDVNRDGIPDLVAVAAGSVTIFLGTGQGQFLYDQDLVNSASNGVVAAALIDMNGDGVPDLIMGTNDNYLQNQVEVVAGGNGTFDLSPAGVTLYSVPGGVPSLVVGNFQGQDANSGFADIIESGEANLFGGRYYFEPIFNKNAPK